jgi:acyl dehydratase
MTSYRRLAWSEITVPADLPEVVDEVSYQRVVMNPGATWDYFPGHYDPRYAERHGHPAIFVNTMHLAGFIDRIATDWAGPYSRVVRRKVSLLGSVYAGDSMVGRGRVVNKRRDASRCLVELEIAVYNQRDELCCPAEVTLELPA